MGPLFFKPGQELKRYEIYRKKSVRDERGRVTVAAQPECVETVCGSIARASQSEQARWSQQGHPITHTIVIRGRTKADAGDEVRIGSKRYHVQGKHDPAGLGFFSTLYCSERLDVGPGAQDGTGEEENP